MTPDLMNVLHGDRRASLRGSFGLRRRRRPPGPRRPDGGPPPGPDPTDGPGGRGHRALHVL